MINFGVIVPLVARDVLHEGRWRCPTRSAGGGTGAALVLALTLAWGRRAAEAPAA